MKNEYIEITYTTVAIIGGTARYLNAYLADNAPPSFPKLLVNGFISGFSGYMFAQTALLVAPSWAMVAAGLGGYMGTQALDVLIQLLRKKFDIPKKLQ